MYLSELPQKMFFYMQSALRIITIVLSSNVPRYICDRGAVNKFNLDTAPSILKHFTDGYKDQTYIPMGKKTP